jgi:hypothetical protein
MSSSVLNTILIISTACISIFLIILFSIRYQKKQLLKRKNNPEGKKHSNDKNNSLKENDEDAPRTL